MNADVARVLKVLRKPRGAGSQPHDDAIRMSGTSTHTLVATSNERPLGGEVGRQGNDHPTPDYPRGGFVLQTANGDRLQDFANTHLNEGPTPGRIPRQWNDRKGATVGRHITGTPNGDDFLTLGLSGNRAGGQGDGKYMEHAQIPRGQIIARAFARTVDDAANVPAVYVSDPTRR